MQKIHSADYAPFHFEVIFYLIFNFKCYIINIKYILLCIVLYILINNDRYYFKEYKKMI
jgi:hypothetical protein